MASGEALNKDIWFEGEGFTCRSAAPPHRWNLPDTNERILTVNSALAKAARLLVNLRGCEF
jgi:hypothetical protein